MLILHLHAWVKTRLDRRHRTAFPCFLDLSLPIVSEHSVLPALAQAVAERRLIGADDQ